MAAEGRLAGRFTEWVHGQKWFQQTKAKWDELDPRSRFYLRAGGIGLAAFAALALAGGFLLKVHGQKTELARKSEILTLIQSAGDELRRLKENTPAVVPGAAEPWPAYLEGLAAANGIPKESFALSGEEKGSATDQLKESLFDLTVKKANIRQIVRLALALEQGTRPVRLRNLLIDAHEDLSGYLDATFSLSAFTVAQAK